jgi:hypothetical protein
MYFMQNYGCLLLKFDRYNAVAAFRDKICFMVYTSRTPYLHIAR